MPNKQRYTQKFRKEWLGLADLKSWLMEKKNSDGDFVGYCKDCNVYLNSNKLCDLRTHKKSLKHVANASNMHGAARQAVIPFVRQKRSNEAQVAEAKIALFIAEHTSIIKCDHLNSLCKNCFKDSRIATQIQIKRTKCSGIIKNILYSHFMDDI